MIPTMLDGVSAVLDDVADIAVGVLELVTVGATEAGLELGVPAVNTGTLFCRYSKGCTPCSTSVALDTIMNRKKRANVGALGWNIMLWRCYVQDLKKDGLIEACSESLLCLRGTKNGEN